MFFFLYQHCIMATFVIVFFSVIPLVARPMINNDDVFRCVKGVPDLSQWQTEMIYSGISCHCFQIEESFQRAFERNIVKYVL